MKYTQYFMYTHERPDRKNIRLEWIERVVLQPDYEVIQADGRIRRWKQIPEAENKYLRVILLDDGKKVHNAFFDRSFRGDKI
jgi:hypothetical protein